MKIHYFHKALFLLAFGLLLHPVWSQTVTIQQPLASTPVSCFGANDGTITVAIDTADGDVAAPFTYTIVRISPSVLLVPSIVSSNLTVTFTGLAPGAYVAAVQDANGVDDPSGPVVSVGNRTAVSTAISGSVTNPVCAGAATGAFTVRGSGGVNTTFDFEITGPSFPSGSGFVGGGARTHTFTGLLAGSYSVVARDMNGCEDTTPLTIVVSQPPALAVTIAAQTSPACAGSSTGSIGLSVTGGTSPYEYSLDGTVFQPSASFAGLPAGSYTLTVRDANGCTTSAPSVTLAEPPALQIILDTQTNIPGCFGDATGAIQVSATGGTAPYTYSNNGGPFTANSGTFAGLSAGNYTIAVRDANGCTTVLAPVVIAQPAQLAVTVASQTNVLGCFGDATGSVAGAATGGTSPYEYSLDGTVFQPSASFAGLPAGSYTLTVRDANGCTATTTATLTEPPALSMTLSPQNPTCSGTATGSISVVAAGGSPTYQYSVNGGTFQASATFTGLAAGSYTLTVRDGKNCEQTLTVTLTAPTPLALAVAAKQDVQNCFGEASGSLTLAATGGTAPYSYSIGGAFQPSTTFAGLAAGSYTLTVRDANGCTATTTATVAQPALLTLSLASQTNITGCNGDATGSLTVAAAGGTAGYQYSLDGATFGPGNVFSGLAAGSYTLTVRDANGCTATATAAIAQPALLAAAVSAQANVPCFGTATGSITITATGGTSPYGYSVDGITFQASATLGSLMAGSYTVTVRDANGCTATTTATLTQPAQLVNSLVAKRDVTCGGGSDGSITVSATGGVAPYSYSLDGTTFSANGGAFTGLAAGSFTVTVRDANGCTAALANVVVAHPAVLQLAASATDAACSGTATGSVSATATGGTAPYQYSIGGPFVASGTFTGLAAGSYTLTVRDANGCTATATAAIAQPALLTLSTTGQTDIAGCNGDATGSLTVAAAGGTAPYSYSIGGAFQPSATFTGLPAGGYTVTVRDSNGCTATAAATLAQPSLLVAAVSARTDIACFGQATGSVSVSSTGGTAPYQYSLDGASFQTSASFTGLVAGAYTVTVRDANGCTATATATLTQPAQLTIALSARQDVTCGGGTDGSLTVSASGGAGPYQYSLDGTTFTANGGIFTGLVAGSYTVTVRDANACTAALANLVLAQPAPVQLAVDAAANITCAGQATGSVTVLASGGASPYQYSLDGGAFQASASFANLAAGNYTVTVRDAGNCTATVTATLTQPAALALAATAAGASCTGTADGSVTVSASGGTAPYSYSWNTAPVQTTATANSLPAGTYTVTVTDAAGCTATATATVGQPSAVAAPSATAPGAICTGQPVPALAATGTGLRWYADAALSTPVGTGGTFTPALDNSVAGSHTFYVTQTVGGCQSAATSVTLTFAPAPAVPAVSGDTLLCSGGSVVLASSAATGNQWLLAGSPIAGATGQTLTVTAPGRYSVRVAQGACEAVSTPVSVVQSGLSATATASDPSCSDPSSGVITVAATGGTAPYRYSLDGNDFSNTTGLFSGLSANAYTVHIRDATGCTITRNASVAAVAGIASATATAANESGCGLADGTLTLSGIMGAAGPYQYFLNGVPNPAGAGNAVFSGLAPATYTVRVLAANGCDFSVAATVGTDCVTCALVATVTAQADPTCNGSDGSITLASSGGVGTVRYSIDGGLNFNTNPAFTGLAAGDYPVVVRDGNGCTVADTVILDAPVSIAAVVTGSNPSTCGVNDGTLTVSNVTGGTAPYQYSLDGINYQGGAVFSGLSGNSYTVSVRDATGCTATFPQLITAPNGITSVTTNTSSESGCASTDGSISVAVLGGSGPYRYFINGAANPAGINANVFSGLAGGVYAIRVETADGCSFSTTAAVGTNCTTPCTLSATVAEANTLCHDGTDGQLTVVASGGTGLYEYSLDGTNFQPAALFAGLSPGSYTVTIRDRNNPACRITSTATLINPAVLAVSVTSQANPACTNTGGSLAVSGAGGSGALEYSLNGAAFSANATFTGLSAGSYTVTVRDASGCTATISAALSLPADIVATLSKTDPSACNVADGQVQVSGASNGTAPYAYSLDNITFQASAVFTGLPEGTYTLHIRDAAGCTATLAAVTLRANVTLAAIVTPANASSCTVADGMLTVGNATGGTAPYQYSIGGPFQASNVFAGLPAGSYTVTLRDANGCTRPLPGATITAPNSITAISLSATGETACSLRDGRISVASVTGGTAPYQYFINGSLNPAGANASLFTGLPGGTYTIRVVTADGCDFNSMATVAAACCLQASVGSQTNPSCRGNDGGIVVSATGGVGSVRYSIDGGGTFQASATFGGLAAGTYTVVVSDSLCQRAAGTVRLTGTQLAATVAGTSPSGCSATNGTITVTAPSGGTAPYQYSLDGVTYGASGTFSGLSSGGYTVFMRDAAGCTATFTETLAPTGGILTIQTGTVSETGCNLRDGAVTVTGVTGAGGPYQYFIDGTLNPAGANNNVFAGLGSGPHTVRVVASNGCDFSATVVVGSNCTATCTLVASLSAQTDPTCTAPLGGFTVAAANGTGTVEYSLDGTAFQASATFTGLAAGTYTVTVRDAAGCRTTVTATLAAAAAPTATVTAANPGTCDASDGTITVTNPSGGTAPYQYSLTGASYQAGGTFTGLSNGSYTVYVRDASGCTATFARTLTTPAAVTATVSAADETACQANDGTVTVAGVTGGTAPYRYFINGLGNPAGVNNPVFGGLSPGSYSIRVISADGCRYTTNIQIGAAPCSPPCTLAASLLYANPNCTAPASGLVTVSATGGTSPYQYSLNGGAFATGTGDFQNLAPGRYDLVVRDATGCQIALPSVQLMAPQGPNNLQAAATAPTACSATDGRITVTGVSGGTVPYLYSLDGVAYGADNEFRSLAPGSYTVFVRDANQCVVSKPITVASPGGIAATVSVSGESACNADDGQADMTVTGGTGVLEYLVNGTPNPAGLNNSLFAGLAPGTYTLSVRDAANCQFSVVATIGAAACPSCNLTAGVVAQTPPTCASPSGGTFTVTAANGTAPYQYSLNGSAFATGTGVFTGLPAGSYTVIVRDAAGCTDTLAPVVFTLPVITFATTSTDPGSCRTPDGTITAGTPAGGAAPYAYSLDGVDFSNTSGVFSGLAAGSYTITVRDANGCTATATQVLSAPSGVTATVSATGETACRAADGSVTVSVSGGTAPFRYSIGGASQAGNVFAGLAPGAYTVRVADAAGCEFSATANVAAFVCPPCTLSASVSAQAGSACFGQSTGTVTVSASGGTAPYQYSLDGGTFQASATFGSLRAGTYAFTVRDAGNCTATVTATLTQPAALALAATAAGASCAGTADGSVTVSASGGTAPFQYSIDGGAFQASAAFTGLTAGSYTVTVRDANGCTTPAAATVGQPAAVPVPVLSGTPAFCAGGGTVLTSSAATGNQWLLEGMPIAGATAQTLAVTAAGNYAVRVTAGGCAATSAVLAVVQTSVTATFATTNVTACAATDGTLTVGNATGGTAPYTYSIGGAFQTSNVFTGLAAGTYTVTVRDAAGCTFGGTASIAAPSGVTATVSATGETACRAADGSVTVSVSGGTAPFRYSLDGGAFQAVATFSGLAPGTRTVRVTDAAGCEFSATATVAAFACPPPVCVLTAQAFSNPVLCNGVSDGTAILVNVAGGSGSYEFSIDNGASYQAGPQFNSLAAGSYTILVRDRTQPACTASFPVVVATRFDVAGIIIVNQPKTCGEKGRITFTNVFGGQAPYHFSVDGTTFATDTVFDNLAPGSYRAAIRDAKGCQFAATIAIVGGEAITATVAQGRQASCGQADGTITVTNAAGGSGVFVYSLDGSTFAGNTTFTGLAAGTYTVYIKEQNGTCVATFPVTVTAAACCQLAVTPTLAQPTACASADGRIELAVANGAAPFTYRLNNGTVQNSSVFGGLGNGSYLVLVRDANGCEATVSVSLASPNALTAQAEQVTAVSCFGQADGTARLFNVTGGSNNANNYEYSQDGATYQNSPLFTGLRAGVYVLFVRDKVNGCAASYPVTVTGSAQITAVLTPANPTACAAKDGDIAIGAVTGGVGPYTYSLDSLTGYQATPRFSNLGNGAYKVYVKDSRGCVAAYPVRLSSPNAVSVTNPSLINPTCQGSNNGEIRMGNANGGQPPYQYAVNGGLYQATGTFTGLGAGTHVVTVKDASGCEYPFTYLLTEPATIVFEVKQTKESTCTDPAGAVEVANPVGGIPPYRFSLDGVDYQASPLFDALQPGDYTMYVRDASRNTCASTKPFTIRGTRNVAYEVAVADIGCSGTEKGKITLRKMTGGVEAGAAVEYEVSINGGRTFRPVMADSVVFDNLDAGLYDIVIGYGAGCRTAARRVTLNAGAIPFDVTATAASCGADNGSASAAIANPIPGKTYYYSLDSLNFFTTPNFPNLKAGTYKMYLRENPRDLCSNIRTFTVPGPDSVRYALRRQDCSQVLVDSLRGGVAPYVIKLTGRRNVTTGTLFANRYDFGSLPDGDYTITVTDAAGCSTLPFGFRVGNRVAYKVKTTPSVAEESTGGVMVQDITGGQRPYEVSVDGQTWAVIKDRSIPIDTVVTGLPVGLLTVYVRDANGCVQAMNTEIAELKFVVPNIFTPNGDGVNDKFFITKLPAGTFVRIVDRWGRTVFETRDYKNEWDGGTYPDGIYYYTVDIAGEQTYKGWVQIWR